MQSVEMDKPSDSNQVLLTGYVESNTYPQFSAASDAHCVVKIRETWTGAKDGGWFWNNFYALSATVSFMVSTTMLQLTLPYLMYRNGGAVFLAQYVICLCLMTPMYYLPVVLGQLTGVGVTAVWKSILPALKGLGLSIMLLSAWSLSYFTIRAALPFTYIYYMIKGALEGNALPWALCSNEWNTAACYTGPDDVASNYHYDGISSDVSNLTTSTEPYRYHDRRLPTGEYFDRYVLEGFKVDGGSIGDVRPAVVLAVLLVYILMAAVLCFGPKVLAKVFVVLAWLPYVFLLLLLVRGLTLPGASTGLQYLWYPRLSSLFDYQSWREAAPLAFWTIGWTYGGIHTLASYNHPRTNTILNVVLTVGIGLLTVVLGAFVVFSWTGYLAFTLNMSMDEIVNTGYYLWFTTMPAALSTVPGSWFWSLIWFLLLFTASMGCVLGLAEVILRGLCDEFEVLHRFRYIVTVVLCVFLFLITMPTTTQNGLMVLYASDLTIGFSMTLVALGYTLTAATGILIIGLPKWNDLHTTVTGWAMGKLWWIVCIVFWIGVLPCYFMTILNSFKKIFSDWYWEVPMYPWVLITVLVLLPIPVYFIYRLIVVLRSASKRLHHVFAPVPHVEGDTVVLDPARARQVTHL